MAYQQAREFCVSMGYRVSVGKGGWCLYAQQGFSRQRRKLDGCRSKVHSLGKLDKARLLSKIVKCDIRETYVNNDRNRL